MDYGVGPDGSDRPNLHHFPYTSAVGGHPRLNLLREQALPGMTSLGCFNFRPYAVSTGAGNRSRAGYWPQHARKSVGFRTGRGGTSSRREPPLHPENVRLHGKFTCGCRPKRSPQYRGRTFSTQQNWGTLLERDETSAVGSRRYGSRAERQPSSPGPQPDKTQRAWRMEEDEQQSDQSPQRPIRTEVARRFTRLATAVAGLMK